MPALLQPLLPLLRDDPALVQVLGRNVASLAVPEPARAYVVAALAQLTSRRPFLVAAPTSTDAERLARDLAAYLGDDAVDLFPAWETLPFERVSPSVETMGRRLRCLWRLRDPERAPLVVVAPVRALIQRLGPGSGDVEPLVIGHGDVLDAQELVAELVAAGYRREHQVEGRGEVAVRGSIVDVYPSTADAPVRIDLWGDEVDRLTEFSVADQRATIELAEVEIFPCRELLPSDWVRARAAELAKLEPWGSTQWERLAEGQSFDGMESWLPWLTDGEEVLPDLLEVTSQIVLLEPRRMRDRAADLLAEEADLAAALARTWEVPGAAEGEADLPRLHLPFDRLLARTDAAAWTVSNAPESPDVATIGARGWDPVVGDGANLVAQIQRMLGEGWRVVVGAEGAGSAGRVHAVLSERGVNLNLHERAADAVAAQLDRPGGHVVVQPLERGFLLPSVKVAVLAESDVTGRRRAHRRARAKRRDPSGAGVFDDLKAGDYVVHHHHGVARYAGMVKRAIGGAERDYLLLEYKGGDKLYVPSDQIDAVRHYTGGETPALSRMGGSDFSKTKARVRSAVQEIAQELVVLYQKRVHSAGYAFGPDTPWQRELEDAFPYTLTPDQASAIDAVKADMESPHPMDRLVVGDVGFGKTEIAIRAAFKAVQDGKQVAVLVPTTLLANQHLQTFSERYAGFPVRVEALSRFLTPGQARKVVQGLERGEVDVVIGTHRLLSEDVRWKDLGLLIIDEEHRFGVTHKETIKKLRANVDVLTLTATPIPRTMEMSLTGILDLSLLNTPPADRQPILTYVGEQDDRAVAEAVRRELLREGQVFFVHNRVQDIDHVAGRLNELVPEARLAIAHGQMDEGTLEKVVYDFWEGEFDVLVCTTIIESGIDMPTVNTLVVDRADLMGLGQLHQLRGRVGRSGSRAYAYLFHPADRALTDQAYERLKTIAEATELGAGFKIAMRDLEIRGAGNLLGTGQHGHIAAVGYDLYCQMVVEAIGELKGEPVRPPAEIKLELPLDAFVPPGYIGEEENRLEAYRRLAVVAAEAEVADIRAEWEDRYGPIPEPALRLLDVARLRAECARVGVREVVVVKGDGFSGPRYTARVAPLRLKTSQALRFKRLVKAGVYKEETGQVQVPVKAAAETVDTLISFLRLMVPLEDDQSSEASRAGAAASAQ
ncbi:MAG: transcription-repair coupling factor [Acidimicrobiales bacterium]